MEPVLGPSQDTLDLPAVHPNRTSRQSSTLWLRGNVSWYRICVHRLPHRTCVLHDVGFLTEPTLCSAYVGSLTGPTLAFCSMADKVWFVSQEPTVYFGSCDSISRLHQVHFSPWLQHGQSMEQNAPTAFVASDSYVRFVRFVRAIHQIRPCDSSDSSVWFNRFVRAIYCNTYIHIHYIQQFCPLPALLNADACLLGWMVGWRQTSDCAAY